MRLALIVVLVAGCADDGGPQPLISGAIQASCDGEQFSPMFGYATSYYSNTKLIVLAASFGSQPNPGCGSLDDAQRDSFRDFSISFELPVDGFDATGEYTTSITIRGIVSIPIVEPIIACQGSGTGMVSITKVGQTIGGELRLDATTPAPELNDITASGTFEVTRCRQ